MSKNAVIKRKFCFGAVFLPGSIQSILALVSYFRVSDCCNFALFDQRFVLFLLFSINFIKFALFVQSVILCSMKKHKGWFCEC